MKKGKDAGAPGPEQAHGVPFRVGDRFPTPDVEMEVLEVAEGLVLVRFLPGEARGWYPVGTLAALRAAGRQAPDEEVS